MEINDIVYGGEKINEPVLIDLINCDSIQRLKNLAQYGIPDKYYHKKNYSRYDHSIGVLILLRRLNANLNEQIAGLLHDVSHTAFSHVVDWVLGDPTKEDYQDKAHLDIIKNSEIPFILEKYGFNYKEISNLESFSLLEKETPCLCADRIEYSLREIYLSGKKEIVSIILRNLINKSGQIVFQDKDVALLFAKEYMNLQKQHWAGDQARMRYYLLADILRKAIDEKIIFVKDLMKTDKEVIDLLLQAENDYILTKLNLLEKDFKLKKSDDGIELKKKFRYVDPEISVENSVKKLSDIDLDYQNFISFEKENSNSFKKMTIIED